MDASIGCCQKYGVNLKVIVLVGVPGSGKSTFSSKITNENYVLINQDTLGNKRVCESLAYESLLNNHSIVVDRCNFDAKQRSSWIRIANECSMKLQKRINIIAIEFTTSHDTCINRCLNRSEHPTVKPEDAHRVIGFMYNSLQAVSFSEGFHSIFQHTEEYEESLLHEINDQCGPFM